MPSFLSKLGRIFRLSGTSSASSSSAWSDGTYDSDASDEWSTDSTKHLYEPLTNEEVIAQLPVIEKNTKKRLALKDVFGKNLQPLDPCMAIDLINQPLYGVFDGFWYNDESLTDPFRRLKYISHIRITSVHNRLLYYTINDDEFRVAEFSDGVYRDYVNLNVFVERVSTQ